MTFNKFPKEVFDLFFPLVHTHPPTLMLPKFLSNRPRELYLWIGRRLTTGATGVLALS